MKRIKTLVGFGIGIPLVSALTLMGMEFNPPLEMKVSVHNTRPVQTLPLNKKLTLLSWNLQFAGSRKHHFFYDGGKAVHVPEKDVRETLDQITNLLKKRSPDIALLQEIDRYSDRTADIDQLEFLRGYHSGLNWVATPYHKVPYVPHPTFEPMGRVNLNLGILSKYQLESAKRTQLALLKEPRWRQYFNLKRAILESTLPMGLGAERSNLKVAVTHLSAFSRGDGTLTEQVEQLKQWMASQPPDQAWILAGDFNLLPPGDDPTRLGEDSQLYADSVNPIESLFKLFKEVSTDPLAPKYRTYLPFNAEKPDRKIDYIFYGGPIELLTANVLTEASSISDHLPIEITFQLTTSQ